MRGGEGARTRTLARRHHCCRAIPRRIDWDCGEAAGTSHAAQHEPAAAQCERIASANGVRGVRLGGHEVCTRAARGVHEVCAMTYDDLTMITCVRTEDMTRHQTGVRRGGYVCERPCVWPSVAPLPCIYGGTSSVPPHKAEGRLIDMLAAFDSLRTWCVTCGRCTRA